ncbi:MAG: TRAM domain-containing protein [Halolamina sp.]
MEIPDGLACLHTAEVEQRGDSYVVEIPNREVALGAVEDGEAYQVALIPTDGDAGSDSPSRPVRDEPPVTDGETVDVEIEDIGDQGDGIARVGPGYVVIVPDTSVGERVCVEITKTRENMAFAEVVERYDRF